MSDVVGAFFWGEHVDQVTDCLPERVFGAALGLAQ